MPERPRRIFPEWIWRSTAKPSSALCAAEDEKIIGGLLFSAESSAICFLAVNPNFRRRHIAEKMLRYALKFMSAEQDISVTTYRDGAAEGAAARALRKGGSVRNSAVRFRNLFSCIAKPVKMK